MNVTEKKQKQQQQIAESLKKALPLVEKSIYKKKNESLYDDAIFKEQRKKVSDNMWKIVGILFVIYIVYLFVVNFLAADNENPLFGGISMGIFAVGLGVMIYLISDFNVNLISRRALDKKKKVLEKEIEEIEEQLEKELDDTNPADKLIKKSIEVAISDENIDKIAAAFVTEIALGILVPNEDEISIDHLKRLVLTILTGTFILESLNLDALVKDEENLTKILNVLSDIKESLGIVSKNKFDFYFGVDIEKMEKSIKNVTDIIETLQKINSNKELAANVEEITSKMKEQLDTKPISKSTVKLPRKKINISKNRLLSAISAADSDVIEIRTRAGTYYTTTKFVERNLPSTDKKVNLLTDKEIEVKIEVLKSTLELLEEEKKTLSKKDYTTIKNDHLMQLMTAEQILTKRRGKFKRIICPHCGTKNSSVEQYCTKCKNQLPYCIVCSKSIGVGEEVSICPHCKSFAHADHFTQWLDKTDICPYCKEKIKKKLEIDVIEKIRKIKKTS